MLWRKLIGFTEEGATQVKEFASTRISATVVLRTSFSAGEAKVKRVAQDVVVHGDGAWSCESVHC